MNVLARYLACGAALCALFFGLVAGASAASPLAALPVGKSANYHLTTQNVKPPIDGGASSTDNYIRFTRTAVAAFSVQVDGAPAGQITLNADGTPNVSPALKKALAPFGEIALLMRGAPQPLAPNASWAANVDVPLAGDTDNVATTVAVAQLGASGASIVANGQNFTEVKPVLREKADQRFLQCVDQPERRRNPDVGDQ